MEKDAVNVNIQALLAMKNAIQAYRAATAEAIDLALKQLQQCASGWQDQDYAVFAEGVKRIQANAGDVDAAASPVLTQLQAKIDAIVALRNIKI